MVAGCSVRVLVGAVDDFAMHVVAVIVLVVVYRQGTGLLTEQGNEGRVGTHLLRAPRAAYVPVQTDHGVGGRHHQMQVVGHHQHTATVTVPQPGDQLVEFDLTVHIDPLHRLVQHQQVRFAQQ